MSAPSLSLLSSSSTGPLRERDKRENDQKKNHCNIIHTRSELDKCEKRGSGKMRFFFSSSSFFFPIAFVKKLSLIDRSSFSFSSWENAALLCRTRGSARGSSGPKVERPRSEAEEERGPRRRRGGRFHRRRPPAGNLVVAPRRGRGL